jgi:hypothetical protein
VGASLSAKGTAAAYLWIPGWGWRWVLEAAFRWIWGSAMATGSALRLEMVSAKAQVFGMARRMEYTWARVMETV